MKNFLPKGKFTWVLILLLAYGYASSNYDLGFSNKTEKESKIKVTAEGDPPKFLEKPAEALIETFKDTETGNAVLKSLVTKAIREKYGDTEPLTIAAQKTNTTTTLDLRKGIGKQAYCGSVVTFHYEAFASNIIPFYSTKKQNQPVTVTLGAGETIVALEQGIVGMEAGGIRKIAAPPKLAYDDPRFTNSLVANDTYVLFDIELLEVKDGKYPVDIEALEISTSKESNKKQMARCGSTVTINYKIEDNEGQSLLTKDNQTLTFTIGRGNVPIGLEQGIQGMKLGEVRTITFPASLTTIPHHSLLPKDLIFHDKGKVTFDIELTATN